MPSDNEWLRRIAIALEGGSGAGGAGSGGGLAPADIAPIVAALNPALLTLASADAASQTFTVPVGKRWRLTSGLVSLSTNATVTNRRLVLDFIDGSQTFLTIRSPAVQTASVAALYSFASVSGLADFFGNYLLVPTPAVVIPSGGRFVLSGHESGDTISSVFQVEEW